MLPGHMLDVYAGLSLLVNDKILIEACPDLIEVVDEETNWTCGVVWVSVRVCGVVVSSNGSGDTAVFVWALDEGSS